MEYEINENQTKIIIGALADAIQGKDEDMKLIEFFNERLKKRVEAQAEEIAALKAKLKAVRPKKAKATKEAAPAPVKRGRGRPKKAVK